MSRIQLGGVTIFAAAALAAAGCGGSSKASTSASQTTTASQTEASPPTGPPLTNAQLISKADLICARVNAKRNSNKVKTLSQLASSTAEIASYERQSIAELAKLAPSSELRNDWPAMLADMRAIAENTAKFSEDTTAGNQAAASTMLAASNSIQLQLAGLARGLGFKDCART